MSTPSRRLVPAASAIALLLLLWACEEDSFVAAPPPPDDLGTLCSYHSECLSWCTPGQSYTTPYCTRWCGVDAPCPAGYACVSRPQLGMVCAMGGCESDADCPANYSCFTDQNVCRHGDIPCSGDTNCPAGLACNQGLCETFCTSDDDCKAGHYCHHSTGCVQCVNNTHCSGGYACVGGLCNTACADDTDCRAGYQCTGFACQVINGGGAGAIGDTCTEHNECVHFCYQSYCSQICEGENDPVCPDGYSCHQAHLVCHH